MGWTWDKATKMTRHVLPLGSKEFIGFPRLWEVPSMHMNCIYFIHQIVWAWLVLVRSNLMMFWHYVRTTSGCYREHCPVTHSILASTFFCWFISIRASTFPPSIRTWLGVSRSNPRRQFIVPCNWSWKKRHGSIEYLFFLHLLYFVLVVTLVSYAVIFTLPLQSDITCKSAPWFQAGSVHLAEG